MDMHKPDHYRRRHDGKVGPLGGKHRPRGDGGCVGAALLIVGAGAVVVIGAAGAVVGLVVAVMGA